MRKVIKGVLQAALVVFMTACVSSPSGTGGRTSLTGNSGADSAEQAAQAAIDAMNNGGVSSNSGGSSKPPAQSQTNSGGSSIQSGEKPLWVSNKNAVYAEKDYLTMVGYDQNANSADQKALGELTALFGRNVQWDSQTMTSYTEIMSKDQSGSSKSIAIQDAIQISSQLDTLIGAEIADRWFDAKGKVYYAIAVMNRVKTAKIYTDIIAANLNSIDSLTSFSSDAKKYSFDGYLNYQRAGIIADANQIYVNVLSVVGDSGGLRSRLRQGMDYRNDAKAVLAKTPIRVEVSGDQNDRIKSAFSDSLTRLGFRTGGSGNSRYRLAVKFSLSEAVFPNNANKFSRYNADASLIDTLDNNELVRYKIDGREGHTTLAESENRAVSAAEKKIKNDQDGFGKKLTEYLSSL